MRGRSQANCPLRPAVFGACAGALLMCCALLMEHALPAFGVACAIGIAALCGAAMTAYSAVLHEQSVRDEGTELFNRRYLFRRIARIWQDAHDNGRPLALAVIDVDDFRSYNSRYGHVAGDAVLRAIACTLRSNVRKGDIVGRWGGEEFAVILPGTGEKEALAVAERLRSAIEHMRVALEAGKEVHVSISIGITAYRREDSSSESFVKRADAAMYKAKEVKNRVVWL
ncbi:GGDEF domain-containing protein [Gordoniibacillus kamchatkensis]|uniref:GGDEF domain-containing protein n=1 Tax=Gordoniibacillus kamchatkensis TaxID=1590651 RepID=UPI0006978502|nr:GGDEF domain-containing protein [Paenibacillus sp. VKM B-2647]